MADRFKTGEKAPENGTYKFAGLVDGGKEKSVTEDEKQVELNSGDSFPPISSQNQAAYWEKA